MRAVEIAARHGVPITPRGGGTSQAGQSIGVGHRARHLEASEPDPRDQSRRALGARRAGRRARRAERGAPPAQPALRAGCVVGQPRHRRRHDGQQLERRAIGAVRQDDRSRARAARGAVGRRARAFPAARSPARPTPRRSGDSIEARAYRADSGARRPARGRDRAPLSEGAAPRRRLQPRCVRRSARRPST